MFQQLAGRAAERDPRPGARARRRPADPRGDHRASPTSSSAAAGLSANKLASLRDLSAKVLDGTVVLGGRLGCRDEEIIDGLVTVRGIGRWTAEMYLMFELRRLDVWPVDDLGVRQGYGIAWSMNPPPTPKQLQPLGDRFRPYRSVVARYCWEAVSLARRGADTALR